MIFDSHAHYNDERFDGDRFELLKNMPNENVGLIMNSCSEISEIPDILELCEKFDFIYGSVGVHPHCVTDMTEADIDTLIRYSEHEKIKAIGEIGLDYYYDGDFKEQQKKWFARQIELSQQLGLPIVIHDRDAHGDCMDILRAYKNNIKGEFHCYSGSVDMAREILDMGMYIAFGGSLTFKNSIRPKEVAAYVPLDRLLTETDCPYLTPVPHRGKRNDSRYVRFVIEEIARLRGIAPTTVENAAYENAKRLFGID